MRKLSFFTISLILSLLAAHSSSFAQSFITATPGTDICSGTSVTFTTSFSDTSAFQWFINSTAVSSDTAFSYSGFINGDTVKCIVVNGSDTSSDSVIMTVHTAPSMSGAIFGPLGVCVGSSVSLTDTVTGGVWTSANATATVSSSAVVTGVSAGLDTLFYTVSNACGSNYSGFVIPVDTLLSVDVITHSGTPTFCPGTTITLDDLTTGGVWSSSNTSATIDATGLVHIIHGGMDTIEYAVANSCGTSTATIQFTFHELPHAGTIIGDTSVCAGSTVTLHDAAAGGVWSSIDPFFATIDATGIVTGANHGSTVIAYTITNACGTASELLQLLNVDIPAPPIIGADTLCQLTLGILIDPLPAGTWSTSNFLTIIPVPITPGAIFGLLPGTATITYTITNSCGTSTATLDVTVVTCSTTEVAGVASAQAALNVFPNPNTGAFTLNLSSPAHEQAQVQATNIMGQRVKAFSVAANKEIQVTLDEPAGVYFITATTATQQFTAKIVVAK